MSAAGAPTVVVGECMLELVCARGQWRLGHAGDTFNTALYLTRLGLPAAYLTALGTDPFSADMRAAWAAEGLDTSLVLTDPARLPGLYAIRNDADGERHFYYWRERSAVRRLFHLPGVEAALERARGAGRLYLSGITLSLFSPAERAELTALAAAVRERGGLVIFDPNYRSAGWSGPGEARAAIEALAPLVSLALPTLADETALFGDTDPGRSAARWQHWGAPEVVVKLGAAGCLVAAGGEHTSLPQQAVAAVDTTGAGDAFNAAYVAARAAGCTAQHSAQVANRLAALVVQHPGAIVPRELMPTLDALC
ncbi:MAG TPA: sugar kinase [Steroidobacteraceae bacterium]|nr:sugar kinase [Steroidobacteraceae bacterium]